jgi:taurine--2-oxoglutarate transaminase
MKRLNLKERACQMGARLGDKLAALKAKHPSIGEVRGIGLFWAVELVKDPSTKTPFNTGEDKVAGRPMLVDRVAARAMSNGVYLQAWLSHFVIAPPLIISEEEIDRGVSVFDEALKLADAEIEKGAVTAANR